MDYRVEVEAPEAIAEPLRHGTDLVRWIGDAGMTREQLRRLADDAVRDARSVAAAEGYFSAAARVEIDDQVQPWRVTLHVEPGERTHVAAVELQVTGPAAADLQAASRIADLKKGWALRAGAPFRQADWESAKREALKALSSWRYAAARVASSEARVDAGTREARLSVVLDSGPAYRFGATTVAGTQRYSPSLVESLSPVHPGDDYDRERLIVFQRRLIETGY
ncbi:MAG TPA: outer membrane protein assembly factor, partial [Burkholderiales bacterium]|nr:outer membrane protein assembly factor [Burkholderiales bacterium]